MYDKYSPKMLSVCRQYIKDLHFAEDVMVSGFVKVFKNMGHFRHEGSFEGWIRKIMVRECITYLRKSKPVIFDDEVCERASIHVNTDISLLDMEEIQLLIDALPSGYKMVFVLYALEGYKHNEIGSMLGISESTSKSQLFKARKMLQQQLQLLGISKGAKIGMK